MNKFYHNIISALLIVAVLPMIGVFCFSQLEANDLGVNSETTIYDDACMPHELEASNNLALAKPMVAMPMPMLSDNQETDKKSNTLLPCCQEGGRAQIANYNNLNRLDHIVLAMIFFVTEVSYQNTESIIYHAPDISPPALVALQTTVLRL